MADFAGRRVYDTPAGVAATREGGLLIAAGSGAMPSGPARRS